jgi:hypothetical protein
MTLEHQLDTLSKMGLTLDDGVTIDDLLYSFDRREYEKRPFDLLLFVLGIEVEREPWGRAICSRVWNFDTESIYGPGSYERIVKRLCRLTGDPDYLKDIRDFVDIDSGEAWLEYRLGDAVRRLRLDVNDDWADLSSMTDVMYDLERDGRRFYAKDNGQAMVLYYLDEHSANQLAQLCGDALRAVLPE